MSLIDNSTFPGGSRGTHIYAHNNKRIWYIRNIYCGSIGLVESEECKEICVVLHLYIVMEKTTGEYTVMMMDNFHYSIGGQGTNWVKILIPHPLP